MFRSCSSSSLSSINLTLFRKKLIPFDLKFYYFLESKPPIVFDLTTLFMFEGDDKNISLDFMLLVSPSLNTKLLSNSSRLLSLSM